MSKFRWFVGLMLVFLIACGSDGEKAKEDNNGNDSSSQEEQIELSIMMFEGGFGSEWVKKSVEEFEEENPNVTIDLIASPDIDQQLQPRVVSGDAPDIINPGPNFDIQGLIENEGVLPLDSYVETPAYNSDELWRDTFVQAQFNLEKDGKVYGIPSTFATSFIWWYDEKLFEDHGWEVPTEWEDLYELKELANAEGIDVFSLPGLRPDYYFQGLYIPLVQKIGGLEAIEAGLALEEGAWSSEPFLKAAEESVRLIEEEMLLDGTMALNHIESQTQFFQRKALFVMSGTWLEGEMQDIIPDDFKLRSLNQPARPEGPAEEQKAVPVSSGWGGGWYVSSETEHEDVAVAFLKHMTSKESQADMVSSRGVASTVIGTEEAIESESLLSAIDLIESAEGYSYSPTVLYDNYPEFARNVENQFQGLMLGDVTVEEFVDYAEAEAKRIRNSQ